MGEGQDELGDGMEEDAIALSLAQALDGSAERLAVKLASVAADSPAATRRWTVRVRIALAPARRGR